MKCSCVWTSNLSFRLQGTCRWVVDEYFASLRLNNQFINSLVMQNQKVLLKEVTLNFLGGVGPEYGKKTTGPKINRAMPVINRTRSFILKWKKMQVVFTKWRIIVTLTCEPMSPWRQRLCRCTVHLQRKQFRRRAWLGHRSSPTCPLWQV